MDFELHLSNGITFSVLVVIVILVLAYMLYKNEGN